MVKKEEAKKISKKNVHLVKIGWIFKNIVGIGMGNLEILWKYGNVQYASLP